MSTILNVSNLTTGFQFQVEVFFDDNRRAEDAKGTLFLTFIGRDGDSKKIALSPYVIKAYYMISILKRSPLNCFSCTFCVTVPYY